MADDPKEVSRLKEELAKVEALMQAIDNDRAETGMSKALSPMKIIHSGSGAKMKIGEINGPNDPLRKVPVVVPEGALPSGTDVWVQADPLKQMHHITLRSAAGREYTTSVTDQVLAAGTNVAEIQHAIVEDLLSQMKDEEGDRYKYAAIPLSYWKYLVDRTISAHVDGTGEMPKRILISEEVYGYISSAPDDLPRASVRKGGHKKVEQCMPKDMRWSVRKPKEGDLRRFIRAK